MTTDTTAEHAATTLAGIELLDLGQVRRVRLWGEVDGALRLQASQVLASLVTRHEPVEIDASEVTFMDSTGIAFMLQISSLGRDEEFPVTLLAAPAVVTDVLAMIGASDLFGTPAPTT
ncbi:hypothetical protein GCM10025865_25720 [Paraoerskovia sediminicola]|uniref:STAS domain-containing protein n=1 Tax=Paraoerskovia sediminicola TaxID=1138587 RepID=A0ABM8G597_9CELL|nr:STAS domain-containing protein [Paraoerskovia sediminicola]BDZ43273.1 hypothetical protein GCM10025865_25720 [Paraoerskovia sediminicola]